MLFNILNNTLLFVFIFSKFEEDRPNCPVLVTQAKRDRNFRAAKPPVGLKRSAVGPLPARAVSTDVDEEEEHIAEAETGPWEDTHMEDREAKKQLRKEKNRASAAASRARREAYTASLEEEVCPRSCCTVADVSVPSSCLLVLTVFCA